MEEQPQQPPQVSQEVPTATKTNMQEPHTFIYVLAFALIAILGVGGFVLYFTHQENNLATKPTSTQAAVGQTTITTQTTTLTPTVLLVKPTSVQSAQNQLNTVQQNLDSAASTENSDFTSLNSDFANTNQGSSEQTSASQL